MIPLDIYDRARCLMVDWLIRAFHEKNVEAQVRIVHWLAHMGERIP